MNLKYRFSKLFKALSDPTRLEILVLLSIRPHCVCELVNIIGSSQPTISRHLQVLTEAGITVYKKNKSFIIYKLSPQDEFIAKVIEVFLEEIKKQSLYQHIAAKTTMVSEFLNP
ncbi:winged helix-turn-helix transcriptional regulator [Thermodesulfobacterium sp. TA1]|uniref:ArsR/SmtB family transcription factor n=1 Tax=Thermodesulfobacterium sp. TA1 TaxID=2234087 RepID=UPI0012326450|nr:metalloregulator ArsR/SmtB family transcription factor [Thermodesulfobacterium sp. TA1]QER42111.1 winged helix-turn-helix transcriptional regulator [Thermodesulfobacterium sp. TA1]